MLSRKSRHGTMEYIEPLDQYQQSPLFYHIEGKSTNSVISGESPAEAMFDDASESMVLPPASPRFYVERFSRQSITTEPEPKPHTKYVHLPPISNRHHRVPPPPPMHKKYRSPHHYQQHRESYDPRWWYMPIDTVHAPPARRYRDAHHHRQAYRPAKWYELPRVEKHFY